MADEVKKPVSTVPQTIETMLDNAAVKKQFIEIYAAANGKKWEEQLQPDGNKIITCPDGEAFYNSQKVALKKAIATNTKLKECTYLSAVSCFMELAIKGLSVEAGDKQECYLEVRSVSTGKNPDGSWKPSINTCFVKLQTWGEVNLRIAARHLKRVSNPVIVYEEDKFEPCTNDKNELVANYVKAMNRSNDNIKACFVVVHFHDGSSELSYIEKVDWERLAGYSNKQLAKYDKDSNEIFKKDDKGKQIPNCNALYCAGKDGQIDTGFLGTKTVKNALKTISKSKNLPLSENMVKASDDDDDNDENKSFADNSNLINNVPSLVTPESGTGVGSAEEEF